MSLQDRDLPVLWEDGERVFCRGWQSADDGSRSAVLVVRPAAAHAPHPTVDRLAHEFGLKDVLDGAWAVRPLALEHDSGRTMLVLEDAGGEPLNRLLGSPMEVGRFLRLAIGIAAALGGLHQRGLVHKDIKPANILVNRASGEVKLTGFGIASRLARERQSPEPPETIAGTLAYMAPEQTGRINRSIDSRSDLYALGVTLCQMLTGSLPFTAADPMEWVHCHIARRPVPPNERREDVPAPISAIIMKLLAKTAEERYQTAGGVERDLQRCLSEWEARGFIDDFPLGRQDKPDRLLIPEKLYGREREVATLLAAFDRIVNGGAPELVLVAGYSGIGKSSVVNELHKVLVPPRGLFASGKFDQYKRDIPYSTLAQAFQGLVRPLLTRSDAELAAWRHALLEALGQNGRLMVDLVPDLRLIIGDQPPVPELPPQQAQSRFQLVFRRFIGVFARAEHPLALFLDDLQWLDAATLDLIEDLLTRSDLQHLILIGAYRDNEVDAAHPLARKLQAIRSASAKVHEVALAPLVRAHVGQLIADALRCEAERAAQLAELVHDRTGGNPFFTIQFLSALAGEGLLRFDHDVARWSWDLERIDAKGYTDNVVDLMVGKLARLPAQTQKAMQQLACVGNTADIAVLSIAFGMSEEQVHADLWEAVRQELVERLKGSYRFVHDRVHEAAYSLIPEPNRAPAHLRIGRLLAERTPPEQRQETIFEIVNQLNRGAALITDQDEREQLAELNLTAGRRAKASTAYTSACTYLRTGIALLGGEGWSSHYELALGLSLEAAECEHLSGNFHRAEQLIAKIISRARSNIDKAAAYRFKIIFHSARGEYGEAITHGLACLRLLGVTVPAEPNRAEVKVEYARIWENLGGRSIETLIDLPPIANPEALAAVRLLSFLLAPAALLNNNLFYMLVCSAANLTLKHGVAEPSLHIYSGIAQILGPVFQRYEDGLRFAALTRSTAEKHGFAPTMAYFAMECASIWSRPVAAAIENIRLTLHAAIETGDLSYACYSYIRLVSDMFWQAAHLDEIWIELQKGLEFARNIKFQAPVHALFNQQLLIRRLRGDSRGSDTGDENEHAAGLVAGKHTTLVCWYWILKLQARYIFEEFEDARAAAEQAAALLWTMEHFILSADHCYYHALTIGALHRANRLPAEDALKELLPHLQQLKEWAGASRSTFIDKYTLVAAEIARIEGRELDAESLYEEAIRCAAEQGFVHNEAVANEVAARFYASRGFETIANAYLGNARRCYSRWGAAGKVRQLDERYPHLAGQVPAPTSTSTMGAPVEHLDLATVIKVSQAVSGEMVLERLLDTLMRTALEQAGAERGLLILSRGAEPRIMAEAAVTGEAVTVRLPDEPVSPAVLPQSVLQYVLRAQDSVILDDAAMEAPFADDAYIREHRARSVLCVPLINRGKLIGGLYLENNLAPDVFVPSRIAVLKLLASQAAIALDNSRLYRDLEQREAKIRRLVDANIVGIFMWDMEGRILEANDAFLRIVHYDRDDLASGRLRWTDLTPPEWLDRDERLWLSELKVTGSVAPYEKEFFRKDGGRVSVLMGGATFEEDVDQGVGFVLDLSERKRAEDEVRESDRRYREAQMELAHANRIATMGQLTASIAHEVKQPIAATVANAGAALRWLSRNQPDVEEVREALDSIVKDGNRAGDIVSRIHDLVRKAPPRKDPLEINRAIREVLELIRGETVKHGVVVQTELADALPLIPADRVQLQQVILNLVVNAVEAMSGVSEGPRELLIRTATADTGGVLVAVCDSGPGLGPTALEHIFAAFYTTKPSGFGLGLSICRSIVEAHGGSIGADNDGLRGGARFYLMLPAAGKPG